MQTDIGSQDDVKQGVGDSGSATRPEKTDKINNDQARMTGKPRDMTG